MAIKTMIAIPKCWKYTGIDKNTHTYTTMENGKEVNILIAITPISEIHKEHAKATVKKELLKFLDEERKHIDKKDDIVMTFNGKTGNGNYCIVTDLRWNEKSIGFPTLFRSFYVTNEMIAEINVLCYDPMSQVITSVYSILKNI